MKCVGGCREDRVGGIGYKLWDWEVLEVSASHIYNHIYSNCIYIYILSIASIIKSTS